MTRSWGWAVHLSVGWMLCKGCDSSTLMLSLEFIGKRWIWKKENEVSSWSDEVWVAWRRSSHHGRKMLAKGNPVKGWNQRIYSNRIMKYSFSIKFERKAWNGMGWLIGVVFGFLEYKKKWEVCKTWLCPVHEIFSQRNNVVRFWGALLNHEEMAV